MRGVLASLRLTLLQSRPLRVNILTAFVGLLATTVLFIVGYTYYNDTKTALKLSDDLIEGTTKMVIEKTISYLEPAAITAQMSARIASDRLGSLEGQRQLEEYAIQVLKAYPQLAMVNIGNENGDFLMPKKLGDGTIATKIINRAVKPPTVTWKYRDNMGKVVRVQTSTKVEYDPRSRPWYQGAKRGRGHYWTDVYVFFTDRKPGITASYPVKGSDGRWQGAVGVDIELGYLCEFLRNLRIGNSGIALIVDEENHIVAYPDMAQVVVEEGNGLRLARVAELSDDGIKACFAQREETGATRITSEGGGTRYIASFTNFPESFGKDWVIAVIVPQDDFIGPIKHANRVTILSCLGALVIAMIFATILSRAISQPIVQLADETTRIKDFHLEGDINIRSSIREIQLMSDAVAAMKTGLRAFGHYVPDGLVRELIQTGEDARLGGQTRVLTLFFSDIANFASVSEAVSPTELMIHVSEYFEELTQIILAHRGTIDKYIGDGIMAFWGAPTETPLHANLACRAALLCQQKVQELNKRWESQGRAVLPTRIGIHTGETVVGNIGSKERMNYSVLGDTVNLASRLEAINKVYGTRIIVSQSTYERVSGEFVFRRLDTVAVKGKRQGITIWELMCGVHEEAAQQARRLCEEFHRGLECYIQREWDRAVQAFEQTLKEFPSDGVTRLFLRRCASLEENPPGPEWNGVIHLESK